MNFRSLDFRKRLFVWLIAGLFLVATLSQVRFSLSYGGQVLREAKDSKRFLIRKHETAKRGTIYSSDGKALAESVDVFEFGIQFAKVPHSPAFFMEVASVIGIPASELMHLACSGVKSRTWREPLSAEYAKDLQSIKTKWQADGLSLLCTKMRRYPLAEATSCMVGVLKDDSPVSGLEKGQDIYLRGVNGVREGLTDRTGAFLPTRNETMLTPCIHGKDITLTIHTSLQIAATEAIRRAVEINQADRGSAIIMDPHTGDLLAMANWPSFHPDQAASEGEQFSDFNSCTMAAFEPGSTFKILTLAKALDLGVTHLNQMIDCKGILNIGKSSRIRCDMHGGHRDHGPIDPVQAIAKSCNVSASTWMMQVGYKEMVKYIEDLGLLQKTQLGLPLEAKGLFNYKEYAKDLQMANVGFGQSVTATPVAFASAFTMIANKGVRVHPRLIRSIDGQMQPVRIAGQLIKPETASAILNTMERVMNSGGTGSKLGIPGYRLAGKTGTAERTNPETGRLKDGGGYISSFVGMVPSSDTKALILVMVENPKAGRYYGSGVAGPTFNELAKNVIRHFKIPATEPIQNRPLSSRFGVSRIQLNQPYAISTTY